MTSMSNGWDLTGRRILITGASSGIGQEIAVLVSELNGKTVLLGRDQVRLEQTRSMLKGDGHEVVPFDLLAVDDIPALIKNTAAQGGPLSGVVHAAGIQVTMSIRGVNSTSLDKVMKTNVYPAAMLARGLTQKNCSTPGSSIVFVSSVMALASRPAISVYSASKAALIGLVKSLALELAPNIRVNCVSPAFVHTQMTERLKDTMEPEQFAAIEALHPLGIGTVRDVANSVAFLLGDTGRWITGTNLVVDGGYSAQ
jgi:NAD(P)-dependent dehydrogenase (short-subunit alcohol dehydrogenase family)